MLRAIIVAGAFFGCVGEARALVLSVPEEQKATLYSELESPANAFAFAVALREVGPGGPVASGYSTETAYFCSAAMITPRWAITMSYCLRNPSKGTIGPKQVEILYGHNNLKKSQSAAVKQIKLHPGFDRSRGSLGGIALIQLERDLPGSVKIADYTVSPKIADPSEIGDAVVVGWGQVASAKFAPPDDEKKRNITVRLIDNQTCNHDDMYGGGVAKDEFCAQSVFEGVDACFGFGGAPLAIANANGNYNILGIVNRGDGCARKDRPTIYTDLTHYITWIEQTIGTAVVDTPTRPTRVNLTIISEPSEFVRARRGLREATGLPEMIQRQISGRVVAPNPKIAPRGKYRYLVSIGKADSPPDEGHLCGGVLISPKWVLTAAHCVVNYVQEPEKLKLRLAINSDILTDPGDRVTPKKIVVHDDAHTTPFRNHKNDIALLELDAIQPFQVRPPSLLRPRQEQALLKDIKSGYVVGYGMNSQSAFGRISVFPHQIKVTLIPREQCNSVDAYNGLVDEKELCAGMNGNDSCQGDSGGPLIIWDDNLGYMLAGLVSWGRGCGGKHPGVYVRVSAHQEWIETNLK